MKWIGVLSFFFALNTQAVGLPGGSTSGMLVEEILSQSKDPHSYDWRHIPLQIEIGTAVVNEFNSFESSQLSLGFARSVSQNLLGRASFRKVATIETASSRSVALTPFSQAAQPSHYEILLGVGYPLLEGRSLTPLSPNISDLGHALYALAALQYNYFTSQEPEPIPGMRAIRYEYAMELGARFQIFLPHALGLSIEWTYSRPLSGGDPDLQSWQRVGGNLSWSFGR